MDREEEWQPTGVLILNDPGSESNYKVDNPAKIFRVTTYVASKYYRGHSRTAKWTYIGLGILAVIIVIAIIYMIEELSQKVPFDESNPESTTSMDTLESLDQGSNAYLLPRGVILVNDGNFWSFSFEKENFTRILEVKQPVGAFDVHSTKSIFWNEKGSSKIISFHASNVPSATHDNLDTIFEDVRTKPKAMAMDHLSGNLYVLDDNLVGKLFVLNVHTRHFSLLMTNTNNLQEIVIDSGHGLIFILQAPNVILKARTNGAILGPLFDSATSTKESLRKKSSLALDRLSKRIYWMKDMNSIRSSSYDGRNLTTLGSKSGAILGLTVYAGHLFRLLHNGSETSMAWCRLLENMTNCVNPRSYSLDFSSSMRAIGSLLSEAESDVAEQHPCNQPIRGGCQHLCLATSTIDYICACSIGMQLDLDGKSCTNVSEFVMYASNNLVRGVTIDDVDSTKVTPITLDVFLPTQLNLTLDSTKGKGLIDFDYGLETDQFFYSDDNSIYVMGLRFGGERKILLSSPSRAYIIEDLAYDWVGDNLYYSRRSSADDGRHSICVMNVGQGGSSSKTLQEYKYDKIFGLMGAPYSLAVDPGDGSIFFSAGENGKRWIMRYSLNGKKLGSIPDIAFVHEHRLLALDYEERRVFWLGSKSLIEHAKYDGSNRTLLALKEPMAEPKTIAVHRSWIYLSGDFSVWRMANPSGSNAHKIVPASGVKMDKKLAGVRLISRAIHLRSARYIPEGVRNSCVEPHNPCAQLCFPGPKAAGGPYCDCKDGMKLVQGTGACVRG